MDEITTISEATSRATPSEGTTIPNGFQYVQALIATAIKMRASDIFLAPKTKPAFRINGRTLFLEKENELNFEKIGGFLEQSMRKKDWRKLEENLEFDFGISVLDGYRIRVNAFFQTNGLSCTVRLIGNKIFSFEELGLPGNLRKLIDLPSGLVLCVGSVGSGKTTTLATLINYINEKHKKHIITIEDPIEYIHASKKSLIEQRSVGVDTKNFGAAIRSAMRQAPDVLLVGELRDLESLSLAITAAETGTLVLGTLHANTAPNTVNRIIDIFPADKQNQVRMQLSQSLQYVIWQKLLPRKDGTGRIAAIEILSRTAAISNLIRENKVYQIESFLQTSSKEDNMLSIRESLSTLLSQDLIEEELANEIMKKRF